MPLLPRMVRVCPLPVCRCSPRRLVDYQTFLAIINRSEVFSSSSPLSSRRSSPPRRSRSSRRSYSSPRRSRSSHRSPHLYRSPSSSRSSRHSSPSRSPSRSYHHSTLEFPIQPVVISIPEVVLFPSERSPIPLVMPPVTPLPPPLVILSETHRRSPVMPYGRPQIPLKSEPIEEQKAERDAPRLFKPMEHPEMYPMPAASLSHNQQISPVVRRPTSFLLNRVANWVTLDLSNETSFSLPYCC